YGKGGIGHFDHANGLATNYFNSLKLHALTNSVGDLTGLQLLYPNGGVDLYTYRPLDPGSNGVYYYLSQSISPQGHVTQLIYENYDPNIMNIRLKFVVDPDGRTNTLTYATNGFSTNLITRVTDPYGRSASLAYDAVGQLTNITDCVTNGSSMAYDEHGWATN